MRLIKRSGQTTMTRQPDPGDPGRITRDLDRTHLPSRVQIADDTPERGGKLDAVRRLRERAPEAIRQLHAARLVAHLRT